LVPSFWYANGYPKTCLVYHYDFLVTKYCNLRSISMS
jgi:hypothetical protein